MAVDVVRKTSRDRNILIGRPGFDRVFRDPVLLPERAGRRCHNAGSKPDRNCASVIGAAPLVGTKIGDRLSSLIGQGAVGRRSSAKCRVLIAPGGDGSLPSWDRTRGGRLQGCAGRSPSAGPACRRDSSTARWPDRLAPVGLVALDAANPIHRP